MNTILLCGGKGERLKPLTLHIPKPMIPINGKPILWYILKQLEKYELGDIYVTVGYKSKVIKEYIKKKIKNKKIKIIDNGDVDIIERIKSVIAICPNDDLLVLYGDTISDVNLNDLISFSEKNRSAGTITVWRISTNFGVIEFDKNMDVLAFREKPQLDIWINIGYFIIRKQLFEVIYDYNKFEDFLSFCGQSKKLKVFQHNGEHITINNLVELEFAEKNINKIFKG